MTSTITSSARMIGNDKVWSLAATLEGSGDVFIAASVCVEVVAELALSPLEPVEVEKSGVALVAAAEAVSLTVKGVGDGKTAPARSAVTVSGKSFFLRELRRDVLLF